MKQIEECFYNAKVGDLIQLNKRTGLIISIMEFGFPSTNSFERVGFEVMFGKQVFRLFKHEISSYAIIFI